MKGYGCIAVLLVSLLLLLPASAFARRSRSRHGNHHPSVSVNPEETYTWKTKTAAKMMQQPQAETLQVAGSRLPDCSHACGSCSPCRLVTVSFVCASLEEAETCPIAYKCMCKNKSYPIP